MSRDDTADRAEPIDVDFEPADHPHRSGVGFGTALVLALLAAGGGAAGGALAPRVPELDALLDQAVPDHGTTGAPDARLVQTDQALNERVQKIEAVMSTPLAEAASTDVNGSNVAARVFALQSGLRDVESRLNQIPPSSQIAELVTSVQGMQQQLPAIAAESRTAAEAARAAFAVAAAAEAARSSGPFEQSFASLQALLPEDPNVIALAPLSRTGAPTRTELRDKFDKIDSSILRAAREAQAGAGFWGRIQAALAQWIIVSRVGQGDTPDGVVERANQRLAADDLAGAIQEINRLSGPAKQVAQPWLNDAQRRLEIDTRIAAIRTELSRRG
jgi:hypothetical protein